MFLVQNSDPTVDVAYHPGVLHRLAAYSDYVSSAFQHLVFLIRSLVDIYTK